MPVTAGEFQRPCVSWLSVREFYSTFYWKGAENNLLAGHEAATFPPLRWANLGGTFQYLYLLPIGKKPHTSVDNFSSLIYTAISSFSSSLVSTILPCNQSEVSWKKLFSSVMLINSCFKFHVWLPTDFQVPISPWNDSYSLLSHITSPTPIKHLLQWLLVTQLTFPVLI